MFYLKLKVHPDSAKNALLKKKADSFEIWTREPAENGKANEAALNLLAGEIKTERKKLVLVKGARSSSKIVMVYD